jgi:TldD protein
VLIQNGVVVGHLQNRETAASTGQAPTGHARAGTLRGAPFPRAANTWFAAGQGTRDDLLAGIDVGVYVTDLLACEAAGDEITLRAAAARMIRHGRLAEPVKGVQIEERLLPLLGRIEAVAGDFAWDTGAARCQDGAAGVVSVTSGAPHVRLVDVAVGGVAG